MHQSKSRDNCLDIVKGIGIFLVVIAHTDIFFNHFIYLFHLAIFFIASGYLFNTNNSINGEHFRCYVMKKIKGLWLPFFIFNGIFAALNNLFLLMNVYTNNQMFLQKSQGLHVYLGSYLSKTDIINNCLLGIGFNDTTVMGGALWFIIPLFFVLILYCFFEMCFHLLRLSETKTTIFQGLISLIFLTIGFFFMKKKMNLAYHFDVTLVVYSLIYIGNKIKQYKIMDKVNKNMMIICSFTLLCIMNNLGTIELSAEVIENPLFFIVSSIAGWFLVYCISFNFNKNFCWISKLFAYFGKASLFIMAFHFLSFKIVNFLQVIIYKQPIYMVAAFPTLYSTGKWSVIFLLFGMLVPSAIYFCYYFLKEKMLKFFAV